jgi:hypothetical protein
MKQKKQETRKVTMSMEVSMGPNERKGVEIQDQRCWNVTMKPGRFIQVLDVPPA